LRYENVRFSPWQDFDIRHKARPDRIGNEVGQPFFLCQDIGDTQHSPRSVLNADRDHAACGIRERDERFQCAFGRGQIAFVFERLALRPFQQLDQVHLLCIILGRLCSDRASE
jgi:hypothetical protein